jgi:hypothetical protein
VLPHFSLQGFLLAILYNRRTYGAVLSFRVPLKNTHDGGLVFSAASGDPRGPFALVHLPRFPADESLIRFDMARKLVGRLHAERDANSMVHEPRRLLSDADSAVDLVARNTVLAVNNLPHCHEPLIQAERRIFKDRAGLGSELAKFMLLATLPTVVLLLENYAVTSATRASYTSRPPTSHQVLSAVRRVREVYDGFLKCLGFVGGFHTSILS